jgi:hypothetical protein
MLTPTVTEILPPWMAARLAGRPALDVAHATQRELVQASLYDVAGRREVYPTRHPVRTRTTR